MILVTAADDYEALSGFLKARWLVPQHELRSEESEREL